MLRRINLLCCACSPNRLQFHHIQETSMDARRKWLAIAVFAIPAPVLAQRDMEPGNWHITTHVTTNGKAEPVQVQDECLKDELKDLAAYFSPSLEGVQAKCNRTPQKAPADSIAYKMHCAGQGFTLDAESSVKIHDAKRFTANMKMDTKAPKERAVVVAKAEGHHTGACKP
jgi:hypothetical protein